MFFIYILEHIAFTYWTIDGIQEKNLLFTGFTI